LLTRPANHTFLYFDDLDDLDEAKTASEFIYNVWKHTNTMEDNNTGPREGQHSVFATNKMNRWRYYTKSAIYSDSVLSDAGAFYDSVIMHNILEFWNYLCFIISRKFYTFCNAFLKLTLDDLIITLRGGERNEKYSPVNGSVIVMYNTCPTSYQRYWQSRTPLDTNCGL